MSFLDHKKIMLSKESVGVVEFGTLPVPPLGEQGLSVPGGALKGACEGEASDSLVRCRRGGGILVIVFGSTGGVGVRCVKGCSVVLEVEEEVSVISCESG